MQDKLRGIMIREKAYFSTESWIAKSFEMEVLDEQERIFLAEAQRTQRKTA